MKKLKRIISYLQTGVWVTDYSILVHYCNPPGVYVRDNKGGLFYGTFDKGKMPNKLRTVTGQEVGNCEPFELIGIELNPADWWQTDRK